MEITSSDQDELDRVLAAILNKEGELDFEQIIPMPSILDKASSGRRVIDGKEVSIWLTEDGVERTLTPAELVELKSIGYPSWYEWRVVHWGTKWSATQTQVDDFQRESGTIEITYETAWSPPVPV